MAFITGADIRGLIPAVDPRKINQPLVIKGQNFLFDLDGPYSGFGNVFSTYSRIIDPEYTQTFEVEGDIIAFSTHAALKYDIESGEYYPVYIFDNTSEKYPWFHAKVATAHYFVKKGLAGVIRYLPSTGVWSLMTTDVPSNPVAVCKSQGRLVILGSSEYGWSAIDDGTALATDSDTGVAQQSLAILGGTAYGLFEVSDGFIVASSSGLIKATRTGGQNPFRHDTLVEEGSEGVRPINPNSILSIGTGRIFLIDKKGFFETSGQVPQRFEEPLMGQYFSQTLLRTLDLSDLFAVKCHYNEDRQLLFISIGVAGISGQFSNAYVYHFPSEKWGNFYATHFGFGEFDTELSQQSDFNFGYLGTLGRVHAFKETAYVESDPAWASVFYYTKDFTYPVRKESDLYVFSTLVKMTTANLWAQLDNGGYAAGLYKSTEISTEPDTSSDVTPEDTSVATPELEDWLTASGSEDWNALTGSEDWGDGDPYFTFPTTIEFGNGFVRWSPVSVAKQQAALNAYIQVGLFRFSDGEFSNQLSRLTNVTLGGNPHGGLSQETEDWLELEGSVDWAALADDTEDWGDGVTDTMGFTAKAIATNDGGQTVYQEEEMSLEHNEGAAFLYSVYTKGLYHIIEERAASVGQTFHLKFLETTGNLAGRL